MKQGFHSSVGRHTKHKDAISMSTAQRRGLRMKLYWSKRFVCYLQQVGINTN
jgi:hypothetical protein